MTADELGNGRRGKAQRGMENDDNVKGKPGPGLLEVPIAPIKSNVVILEFISWHEEKQTGIS